MTGETRFHTDLSEFSPHPEQLPARGWCRPTPPDCSEATRCHSRSTALGAA